MAEFQISLDNLTPLKDKVVLITGASSGIGKATTKLCLTLGAKVIAGDINPLPNDLHEELPSSPSGAPARLFFMKTDVTDWPSIRTLFVTGKKHFGQIDHVFANAGIAPQSNFLEETFDDDPAAEGGERLLSPPNLGTLQVNLLGMINTVRLGAYYLRGGRGSSPSPPPPPPPDANGGGGDGGGGEALTSPSIVLTASATSFQNFGAADYAISKHGALGILRGLVGDLKRVGVRLNAVAPSWTESGMVPRDLLTMAGAIVQEPEVVARSAVLLFNDGDRNGEVIYSWHGRYCEINRAEGGLLDSALKMLPNEVSEEVVMERIKEVLVANGAVWV